MYLFETGEPFAIVLTKDSYAYQMEMYVNGQDVLRFSLNDCVYPHRWRSFDDIVEWFEKNMHAILQDEPFPLSVKGASAAELYNNSFQIDFKDDEKYEILQEWAAQHSWFSAREGAFLADVFFRAVDDKIEISWDNTKTFQEEGVTFLNPRGCGYVDRGCFKKAIDDFIQRYREL